MHTLACPPACGPRRLLMVERATCRPAPSSIIARPAAPSGYFYREITYR